MPWWLELACFLGLYLLWNSLAFVASSVILRQRGIPFLLYRGSAKRGKALERLSDFQYVLLFGVIQLGWGLFFARSLLEYVNYKHYGGSDYELSLQHLLRQFIELTLIGIGYGYWTRKAPGKETS